MRTINRSGADPKRMTAIRRGPRAWHNVRNDLMSEGDHKQPDPRVAQALRSLSGQERDRLTPVPPPERAAAMKAVMTRERFSDPNWIFERKLDGVRCVAIRSGAHVRLLSRNDLSMNARYPEVAAALESEPCDRFAVDGEIVAFDGANTSFARLAQRQHHYVPVFLYVFDVLWLEGNDVRALPLRTRKRLLRATLTFQNAIRWTPHRNGAGEAFFKAACRKGWEGLVAKRAESPYTDSRSRDWLKFKCEQGQELVIGGYTAPHGSRLEFGALLLGYYAGDKLSYAGKVGTGFDEATLHDLGSRLRDLRRADPPFPDAAAIRERGVTWVKPELVAQVGFTEWTSHGRLRHPRFLGLRDDKPASEVVREG
jgi:bifunctional non-homologous end joining protein LigD